MSSHHIVRDEQEPALCIVHPEVIQQERLGNLLEWSPVVIVIEEALTPILQSGVKIDIFSGYAQTLPKVIKQLQTQSPVKILQCQYNTSPFIEALHFITASKHKAVNIIANIENHEICSFIKQTPKVFQQLDIVLYAQDYKCMFINNLVYKKWVTQGQEFQIIATSPNVTFSTNGLKQTATQPYLTYIAQEDGIVCIKAIHVKQNGWFWLKENI
jgi:thiamine pyrophosphokinase